MVRRCACVGRSYPSYRYTLSREKLREYAQAMGVQVPEEGDLVAPLVLVACLGDHPALAGGAQEFDCHRPARVGDVLICMPSVVTVPARGGSEIRTAQVHCADAATGEPVITARSTVVLFPDR